MTIAITGFPMAEDMGLEPIASIYPVILGCILFQNFQCHPQFSIPKNLRLWHQNGTNNKYIDLIKKCLRTENMPSQRTKGEDEPPQSVLYMK